LSFRGIDNSVYYMIDPKTGGYLNYTGCGNTLNCNHPVVRDLIRDCLRYWVTEMHVDGFRFDLASVLGRGEDGAVLPNPPLLERLAADPILANTKLIAEAWDAAGLYQVGSFPAWGRWAEWNGRFRDDIRRFVKGDAGMVPTLATRLYGSPDLYQSSERQPYHSINFITCHDGFTLADLVSYNAKHNEMNGEGNADGLPENLSWNCGAEGPTDDPEVLRLRRRQMKNFATILMMAHGVPMILAGDELGRTQRGNNNAYCQDNPVSWLDWRLKEQNADLFRFFRLLIAFRRTHPAMRRISFAPMPCCAQVAWHGVRLGQPDWSWHSRSLAMQRWATDERAGEEHVYFIANAHWEPQVFEIPRLPRSRWYRFVDTMLDSPADIAELSEDGVLVNDDYYKVGPRSTVVLRSRPEI
jgi:glycogen operon protein